MLVLKVNLLLNLIYLKELTSVVRKMLRKILIESTDMELSEIVNNGPYAIPNIKNARKNKLTNQKINTLVLIRKNSQKTKKLNIFFMVV